MFGHGPLPGDAELGGADFCAGVALEGVEALDRALGADVDGVLEARLLGELGAAAAAEMPATAPPVARAPDTIVAPSSLDMVISSQTSYGRLIAHASHPRPSC
jgi:hypothetical protein